ncbi:MAG: LuxR C-terminal-related transcriptional regulator, partial [Trebonia sp.]
AEDNRAMGWALLVMAAVTTVQAQMSDALPLYDRALTVTQADPALSDLRLLLQINKTVTLAGLDQYEQALTVARQARDLANRVGTTIRLSQAHGALAQLLFKMGHWEDALTEVAVVPADLKEPGGACCDLGIAAVISFHRGDMNNARSYLTAAIPYSERIGHRLIAPLALARSFPHEQAGELQDALEVLAAGFEDSTEDLDELEDLIADTVRLATRTGELATAKSLTERSIILAEDSPIPHRQANALYCRGMLDHDPHKLMAAAARYEDASRPLLQAKAFEAAAVEFVEADEKTQGRDAFSRSVGVYEALGAAADVQRVLAVFRGYGIRRGPHSKHRQAQSGWDSLTPMEQKIAAFVEEGLSNPDIAARLMLSRRTIGTHVSHILKKLGVSSRTDIARESALRSLAAR